MRLSSFVAIFVPMILGATTAFAQTRRPLDAEICACTGKSCTPSSQYTSILVDYIVRPQDTLTDILYKYGVGARTVPFCLYEPKRDSWLDLNKRLNPTVKNWLALEPGTKLRLVVPVLKNAESNYAPPDLPRPIVVKAPPPEPPPKPQPISWGRWAYRAQYLRSLRTDAMVVSGWSLFSAQVSKRFYRAAYAAYDELGLSFTLRPRVAEQVLGKEFYLQDSQVAMVGQKTLWRRFGFYWLAGAALGMEQMEGVLPDMDADKQLSRATVAFAQRPLLNVSTSAMYVRERWYAELMLGAARTFGVGGAYVQRGTAGLAGRWLLYKVQDYRSVYLGMLVNYEATVLTARANDKSEIYFEEDLSKLKIDFNLPWAGVEVSANL